MIREQANLSDPPLEPAAPHVDWLLKRWQHSWNNHDARSLADLVAVDVDFITVSGRWLRGRVEFFDWHERIHRSHLRASCWTNLAHRMRRLPGGLLLVHIEWTIENEIRFDGHRQSDRSGIFTWLVGSIAGCGCIVAAQNTNLGEDMSHRLAPRVRDALSLGGGSP